MNLRNRVQNNTDLAWICHSGERHHVGPKSE